MRVLLIALLMLLTPAFSQELPEGFKRYTFVMLSKGPDRGQDEATLEKLQAGHLANISRLAEEGKLDMAGPFLDEGEWRGVLIFNLSDEAEVRRELEKDPAIQAGRLKYELHPWMARPGSRLR